jgi:ribosomal-protein-serine acetyltransferase
MFNRTVGPGIEIRQFVSADVPAIFAAVERNRQYLREWLPWVDRTRSAEDLHEFISRVTAQFAAGHGPNAGVWVEGVLAGGIGVHPIDWANFHCSLGYWLDAAQQGKGTITRCCAVLLDYLFDDLGLHRVEIRCGTGNLRSCAIPQRLGFTRESVAREAEWVNERWVDLVVWSMLEEEWRQRWGAER